MKRYIKKTAIVFLIISIIMSSINIFAIKSFAEEVNEIGDSTIQSAENLEINSDKEKSGTEETEAEETEAEETEAEETEAEETGTEETGTEETETEETGTEETGTEEIETEETGTEKTDTKEIGGKNLEETESENINNEIMLAESSQMITAFVLARTSSDFSYYYTSNTENVFYCTVAEINDVILNATEDIVIEMNNDVELGSTLVFSTAGNYTLDLKDNSLTIVSGLRMIEISGGSVVTIKNGTLKGSRAVDSSSIPKRDGAAIYCESSTLNIENLTITENAGRNGGGIYSKACTIEIKNSNITNNIGSTAGAAIYASYLRSGSVYTPSIVKITNSVISGNEFSSTSSTTGGTIYLTGSTLDADNVKILNNGLKSTIPCAGVYLHTVNASYVGVSANLKNSLIAGNHGSRTNGTKSSAMAAGIMAYNGDVTLENTVVRNNTGYNVGGISVRSTATSLKITGGAIYNNTATNPYEFEQYCNDMYITQGSKTTKIEILAADEMVSDENDKTFNGYYWDHYYGNSEAAYEKLSDEIKLDATSSNIYHVYNASNVQERIVATVNGQEYTTIQEAVNIAQNNDTVKLVIGESDNLGTIINEAVTVNEEKNITIDLNGKKWNSGNASLRALTIEGNATVKITGEGTLKDIAYNAGNLELDSVATINTIYLASGKVVKTTSNFPTDKLNENISFVLTEDDHKKLETEDITLIETANDFSEEMIKQIEIIDANSLVNIISDENGNIIAHTLKGIFLNGESGDDANDGSTANTPVKTFEKAKELLNNSSNTNLDGIFVTGTVIISETEEWSLPENARLIRYAGFDGYLIDVQGNLTLSNIIIDGYGEKVEANSALIKVSESGTLNINEGTKLVNNNHTKTNRSYIEAGGAIYVNGKVNMSGGEISKNTSWYGAGIHLWGENASMVLDGGSINNNRIKDTSSSSSGGGAGIAIMQGAVLTMNGGEVSNNESTGSRGIGGGILVGVIIATDDSKGSTFIMNGGKVSNNTAILDGGGIFVQCMSTATINAGEISYNNCEGSNILTGAEGVYGGGGIYVNGGRTGYEDGKLYIPNAYISGNFAKGKEGAAIAGCGTSTVIIYPEAATIYNNDGTSQIYVDSTMKTGYGNSAKVNISKYAVGGGDNHWNDGNKELTSEELRTLEPETKLVINNADAENVDVNGELSPVKIIGNTSATRGGGIGTNGYVQIGYDDPIYEEIIVTKTWEDNDNYLGLRPDSIKVHLFANDEEIQIVEVTEKDNWKYTFSNLEKYDENGDKIEYIIAEEVVPEYETKIDGYNIINICKKQIESGDNSEETTNDNNKDNKNDIVDTSDNIIISFTTLIVGAILVIIMNKSKKHVGKHVK